ncbi:alpha/beta hydrolase [Actinoalloteichus hymeniacidonis]|uniref:Hydrolase or acyltransferase of alpha/beta superfamily n=1 Tax=Actinoalloteichus hymeniacidonis TaxID=340345 RepID=A0AAC9MXI5_9PSEU|nr:alpha/beta hydrolase [Actinoalloteichus hymeniacidonis]AOS62369.1 putative hydrolase or acyltransferase of alpha/beta superfamily [Actinoalloteichus hymeniacidonis]MBB5909603.1 pimeloyl-ACP methyl ester carboxylesterase [Actinoalloteichus hymeniacidonis]
MAIRTSRGRRGAISGMGLVVGVTLGLGTVATPVAAATELDEFYNQEADWQQCEEPPPPLPEEEHEDSIIVDPWKGQWKYMECTTVSVPLDYQNPDGDTLELDLSRIKATDPDSRKGVLLFNPGGPGGGGLSMPLGAREFEVAAHFDLIGFNPRGVSYADRLFCERVTDLPPRVTRPTDEQFAAFTEYAQEKEAACERESGDIRPFINTANTARDMDVMRAVLDEEKINYLGYSYGTYLGAVYGSLFPEHLNRSVLDSSIHPDWLWREQFKQQAVGVRFNVEQWAGWVAERDDTYHLGTTMAEVLETTEALTAALAVEPVELGIERPEDWYNYWPTEADGTAIDRFLGMGAMTRPTWDVVAEVIVELRQAAEGGTELSADTGTVIGLLSADDTRKIDPGVYDTVTCEADWPADVETYYEDMRHYREQYPYADFNGAGVIGAAPTNCTFRSFDPIEDLVELERDGYPTGLVIQGDGDPATQYEGGPAMAEQLDNPLISVRDTGGHGFYGMNECVTEKVDDYLINGELPAAESDCADQPRPEVPADGAEEPDPKSEETKEARVRAAIEHQTSLR